MKQAVEKVPAWIWILLIGFVVWGFTLTFDFVWDDFPMIVNNPSLLQWKTLISGWSHDFWMLHEAPQVSGYWRPMATVVHVLISSIFGKSPWVFHLLNVSLHLLVTWFFYTFLTHIGMVRWKWIPVLFFLVHPVNVETVSFVSAIPDLLCACFGWSAIAFWTSPKKLTIKKILITFFLLSCSFFSKESGVFFGVFIILIDLFFSSTENKLLKHRLLYFLIAIGIILYALVHMMITSGVGIRGLWGETIGLHVATVCKIFGFQLFLLVLPIHASPTRDFALVTSFLDVGFWIGVLLFTSLIAAFIFFARKKSPWTFVILFYLVFWFPISNVLPAEGLIADRYLYVPCMAFAFGLGVFANRYEKFPKWSLIILVILGMWSMAQSLIWRNQSALWGHSIVSSPHSSVAWNEWGNILLIDKKYDEAHEAYEKAVVLQPKYQDASFNSALSLFLPGKLDEAKSQLEKHLGRYPNDARAYDLLGTLYESVHDYERAMQMTNQAVSLAPDQWKYRYNLAGTYLQLRKYDLAIEQLQETLKIVQNRFEVWKNLAAAYCQNADYHPCLDTYQEFIRRFPEKASEVETQMLQTQKIIQLTEGS